jgi:5-methylcytosine-specific restriction enzyme B
MTEQVPVYQRYMNPILAALRGLGGSASIEALDSAVIENMTLPHDVVSIPHTPDKPDRSEVSYRMAWARTYLKYAGLVMNPKRGVWALTEQGATTDRVDEYALASRYAAQARAAAEEAPEDAADSEDAQSAVPTPLHEALRAALRSEFESALARGVILRAEQATAARRRFRERFGPEVLGGLDGEPLLTLMHGRGTKDSLVYWLEFKEDEEFPRQFGSIAGGSALKFGIYQSKQGDWWTGTATKQEPLSVQQALTRARVQRSQLLDAARVLEEFSSSTVRDYAALQRQIEQAAPELADTAWGHKYLSLLFPDLLDDFHAKPWQRHHLVKLLQVPTNGRYSNAEHFIRIARELSITPNQLCGALNQRNGAPHEYWRVGTTLDGGGSEWPRMRDGGFMAIGWTELGDLSSIAPTREGRSALRVKMAETFPGPSNVITRKTQEVFSFAINVHERDIVVAMEGRTVKGIGVVRGGYFLQADDGPFGHRHTVEWLETVDWQLSEAEGQRTTFVPLGKHVRNLIELERRILDRDWRADAPPPTSEVMGQPRAPTLRPLSPLTGVAARVQAALDRKAQVILYGPPGTGKTYWADRAIWELVARAWFGKEASALSAPERQQALEEGAVSACTFHPAYGYEDFIEGYRPFAAGNGVAFRLEPGIFRELCERARRSSKPHFLLIDEINRGDVPRIFGELLTLLEKDKRNRPLTLPVSRQAFSVPENVRVVATMNTADRSIALLDAALRRRFAFVELLPDYATLGTTSVGGLPLGPWLRELNERIVQHAGRDARNLQVGHAYLLQAGQPLTDAARFLEVFRDDIVPLLEEYCYGDDDALARILGTHLVLREPSDARGRLIPLDEPSAVISALLQSFEGLATAPDAIAADDVPEGTTAQDDAGDDEDDNDEAASAVS